MIEWLSTYRRAAEIIAAMALLAAVAAGIHWALQHQQDIGYERAKSEYEVREALATAAAAKVESALNARVVEAQNNAIEREKLIQASSAAAVSASNSLRDTLATIRGNVPSVSADALRQTTVALATVLTDCQAKYTGMAAVADQHASDVKTLIEAWPQKPE